jgi:hypothetical protein
VAIICAHAAFATSGIISGVGLAIAKIIGSLFIDFTISELSAPATETHTNISLHFTASAKPQIIHSFEVGSKTQAVFVILVNISLVGFKSDLHL